RMKAAMAWATTASEIMGLSLIEPHAVKGVVVSCARAAVSSFACFVSSFACFISYDVPGGSLEIWQPTPIPPTCKPGAPKHRHKGRSAYPQCGRPNSLFLKPCQDSFHVGVRFFITQTRTRVVNAGLYLFWKPCITGGRLSYNRRTPNSVSAGQFLSGFQVY